MVPGSVRFIRTDHAISRNTPPQEWPRSDGPRVANRQLNQWDNVAPKVDIERGYGGETLFRWDLIADELTSQHTPVLDRLNEYARLLASVGINNVIVNNVNVAENGSQLLQIDWLPRIQAVGDIFRAWGVRIGLSICYAAPTVLKELTTSDPREASVRTWWKTASKKYEAVPDCLGFLVKADSEGQPGPMDYDLDHAQGAQHLADALAPHGGTILWRAFVYDHNEYDTMTQPYRQFKPLDGQFADNFVLQVKNGPRDFKVREPIHPLLGALPQTATALELQITQEYMGHDTHLCFLPSQWEWILTQPAHNHGTLADFISSKAGGTIAGVANTNDNPNWTGHIFGQANSLACCPCLESSS